MLHHSRVRVAAQRRNGSTAQRRKGLTVEGFSGTAQEQVSQFQNRGTRNRLS